MQVEEAGADFYLYLSQRVSKAKVKRILGVLSDQELEHKKIFREMAEMAQKNDTEHTYSMNVGKLLRKDIKDLKGSAFNLRSLRIEEIDMPKCFELAIRVERQAAVIYQAMKNSLAKEFEDILLQIIHEEERHLRILLKVQQEALQ